ncbi:MAG: DUF934 domain-containing protein [Burkholderiaceae bacterium]
MKYILPSNDRWHGLGGEDGPPVFITPAPYLLLELAQWHAFRAHWPAAMPVGLRVANDVDIEALEPDLPRIGLVALQFPKLSDGRAYSQARLLRARFRYTGEIRATGDVVVDMLPLLGRTGFDAVKLRADQSIDAADRALHFFRGHYQGDLREPQPLFALPAEQAQRRASAPDFVDAGGSI